MIGVWITFVLTIAATPLSGALQLAIIAPRDVTDSLVRQICAEAEAIWKPEGVALECHRIQSEREASGWPLMVTIDEHQTHRDSLGWILFTTDGPGRSIYLSQVHAEELVRQTPYFRNITVSWHEMLIGRPSGARWPTKWATTSSGRRFTHRAA